MLRRVVEVSNPSYLRLHRRQLIIEQEREVVGQVPIEDIGALILACPQIVVSVPTICAIQQNNAVIVFCDERYMPLSVLLPLEANSLHSKILKQQIKISKPVQKRIWRQIVTAKVQAQSKALNHCIENDFGLSNLIPKINSGDSTNIEAQAAQRYWPKLFGKKFRRDTEGPSINALLNYGYAILRATTARAICASGLHPALGVFHHNQYNAFCLADDLIEPFRPLVDSCVWGIAQKIKEPVITKEVKND